jgi:hypothetical protein
MLHTGGLPMSDKPRRQESAAPAELASLAGKKRTGFIRELAGFLRHYRNWWLIPIVVMLLAAGVITVLGGTAVAPLIYTLF